MQSNTQIPMPAELDSGRLVVHSIWPTLQGEGPFAGRHAIFIRLAGCNLQCPWCDTEYTQKQTAYMLDFDKHQNISDLITEVQRCQPIRNRLTIHQKQLVVITGGEPYRQNLALLVETLIVHGYRVQIETNGTLYQPLPMDVVVVCSPKTPRIDSTMAMRANCYKYVLDSGHIDEQDGLPAGTLGKYGRTARPPDGWEGEIFVQPLDQGSDGQGEFGEAAERNRENLAACVRSVQRYGYRLCIQTHKLANVA